jgi:tRNA G10  N-methylase Trm11
LLVNLVFAPGAGRVLLDPFAGVGGIILEAIAGGYRVVSADVDPALRYGCRALGARHSVADATHLPFGAGTVDAIATEPPYHRETEGWIAGALAEMGRVLRVGGRLAVMCAGWQAGMLQQMGAGLGLRPFLDAPINRKGTDCAVLAWERIGAG